LTHGIKSKIKRNSEANNVVYNTQRLLNMPTNSVNIKILQEIANQCPESTCSSGMTNRMSRDDSELTQEMQTLPKWKHKQQGQNFQVDFRAMRTTTCAQT
jgi:protoporphyrinogen oxidase